MGLKDWKRVTGKTNSIIKWVNLKTGSVLSLDDWHLISSSFPFQLFSSIMPVKGFKTKNEALTFAKSYMRTH